MKDSSTYYSVSTYKNGGNDATNKTNVQRLVKMTKFSDRTLSIMLIA
jgi:hypothetical protein